MVRCVRVRLPKRSEPGIIPRVDAPVSPRALGRRCLVTLATAAPLAACASVPDVDDTLSPALAAVLRPSGRLARRTREAPPDGDTLELQYNLQAALAESPFLPGNQTTVLRSGADGFAAMFKGLRQARDHINLEYYVLSDIAQDGVSLSDILLDRLRHGVVVNVIYDSYGSRETPAAFFTTLRSAGARVMEFNPLDPFSSRTGWSPNDRDHRKIMVVDGRIAFTGGINLDKAYENPPAAGAPRDGDAANAYWRDTAVRIEGPAVGELQKLFLATWHAQKGPDLEAARYLPRPTSPGVQRIRIVGSEPGIRRPVYYVSLITAIRSARRRIWLSSGYFVPPHQEREDLNEAARAGVDVRLVLPSVSDVQDAVYAARAAYGDLLEAGARIWEVQNAVLHSKLAVVDSVWSAIGSSNLDRRSVVFNNEADAIILGRETAQQIEAILRADMDASHEVTLDAWRQRSFRERWRELGARIWDYWM